MIDKLITLVKKQEKIEFNELGYKIIEFGCNVTINSQKYNLTLLDSSGKELNYICKDVNSLYELLRQYGMEE